MNIIIVGCGRVGFILAKQLSAEKHDITLVDRSAEKIQPAVSTMDVQGVTGNATTFATLMEAGVKKADILIAVTSEDEINMISCMIAKKANSKCQTIARIRKPEYLPEHNFFKNALNMSMIINPEFSAAREILQLISIPEALEVDSFARGRVELLRLEISHSSILNGMRVQEVSRKFDRSVLICILVRDGEVSIPNGNTVLAAGDNISVIISKHQISEFYNTVNGTKLKPIKDVMIAGGGTTAHYLAELLIDNGVHVKIIEQNRERCEYLCNELPKAEILNANAANHSVLLENGLEDMDAFVSMIGVDSESIFLSLYAHQVSERIKLITRINKMDEDEIITSLPIGSVITPRRLTAEHILQHVRAAQNSEGSNVEALYKLMDDKVEALEFAIREDGPACNVPFMELKLKKNLLVCAIVRGKKIITPSGRDMLKVGDTVVVVTTNMGLNDISDILE